jgi:hypothetical protein
VVPVSPFVGVVVVGGVVACACFEALIMNRLVTTHTQISFVFFFFFLCSFCWPDEHITLPRHFTGGAGGADHVLRRAEPGETEPTELYNFFSTPSSAFIEWGIGVDLYFSSLRLMAIAVLIAGIINIPNIMFYASTEYSPVTQQEYHDQNNNITSSRISWSLIGSAICTTGKWVACPTCTLDDFDFEERFRLGVADNGEVLVLQNGCNGGNLQQGTINMLTLVFLSIFMFLTALYLRHRAIRFDEDK